MKKNILTIVILAATIVNITLSAIILFTIVPKAQRTDSLIQKIVSMIDLELENPDAKSYGDVDPADQEYVALSGNARTVAMKPAEGDVKIRYTQVSEITVVLNKKSDKYETIKGYVTSERAAVIYDIIDKEIGKYTVNEYLENREKIEDSILQGIRDAFGAYDVFVNIFMSTKVSS